MTQETVTDRRRSANVWISVALDDMKGVSSDAFRVYFHIVRRVGRHEKAWPSYRSIGAHCFPELKEDSARVKAIKAVKELIAWNLIEVEKNQTHTGFHSNNYYLTDESEWRQSPDNSDLPPSSPTLPPSSPTLPPSSPTLPPSSPTLPIRDLQYKDLSIKDLSVKERSPLTPQGESHSQNGDEEINLSEVGDKPEEDIQPETPLLTPQPQKSIPFEQSKNSAQDQNRRASALFFGITTEEYERIKDSYNQHKPEMWQEQKTLYKALKDELRGLIGGEDFGCDIGAFLTRLENALKWVASDPWWSTRKDMGLRELIGKGRIFKFSDAFSTSKNPTAPSSIDDDDVPLWAIQGYEQAQQNKAG